MKIVDDLKSIFFTSKSIPGFDGLRGVCVILVLLHHSGYGSFIDLGEIGVYTFFCLSGFLIIPSFSKSLSTPLNAINKVKLVAEFYKKRALRIFPAYYFALFILYIPVFCIFKFLSKSGESDSLLILSLLSYTTNFYMSYVKNDFIGFYSHFWTLAVEQQFYIVCPILLIVLKREYWRISLFFIAVVLFIFAQELTSNTISFYTSSFVGFFAIMLGGVAGLLEYRCKYIPPAFTLFISVLVFLSLHHLGHERWAVLLSVPFFALSIKSIKDQPENWIIRILEFPYLRGLGVISYGFYIYHNFCVYLVAGSFKRLAGIPASADLSVSEHATLILPLVACTAFLMTLLISILSYLFIEKRFMKR